MGNTFFYSDPHFGHAAILKFTKNGIPIRPFVNIDEMHNIMISNYNRVVKDDDTVFFLGDVAYNEVILDEIMPQLKGNKRLILGNHDNLPASVYTKYFYKKLYSWYPFTKYFPSFVASHYPLHYDAYYYKGHFCVHGHIHDKEVSHVYIDDQNKYKCVLDLRYINVCVEKTNYTPLHIDELLNIMIERKKLIDQGQEVPYTR